MDFSKFASVGETGRMLVPNEAGYPKLVQQEVPRNPLGNDLWNRLLTLRKATFFVAFPETSPQVTSGHILDVVPLDQQVWGNQDKADKLPIVGPSSIPTLGQSSPPIQEKSPSQNQKHRHQEAV